MSFVAFAFLNIFILFLTTYSVCLITVVCIRGMLARFGLIVEMGDSFYSLCY